MTTRATARNQHLRIIAQDPAVQYPRKKGHILTALAEIPVEQLNPGPWGHRVQVIDYDSSTNQFTQPPAYIFNDDGTIIDPFAETTDDAKLVENPNFHAQNVYAIVMRTLGRFEQALGRRVSWAGKNSHQLKVVPHAFSAANAFYTRDAEALLFGYFPDADKQNVYACLSHDVVAHETTHALLDALHERYMDPSSPDQGAFHEAFADIVALLSVFSLAEVVKVLLQEENCLQPIQEIGDPNKAQEELCKRLRKSALLGLAEQMGETLQMQQIGAKEALRRSVNLDPDPNYYQATTGEYQEPHRRGEILVAAVMNAFVSVWAGRLLRGYIAGQPVADLERATEEGADAASYLLTMAIRSLDYMPPLHIVFGDYLSALITADAVLRPDDSRYHFRDQLRTWFRKYGIEPSSGSPLPTPENEHGDTSNAAPVEDGAWVPVTGMPLKYDRAHFEQMMKDPDEVFFFIWENRDLLRLQGKMNESAYTKVLWVRPCVRTAPDGFVLRETVAEFYQVIRLHASELGDYGLERPEGMPDDMDVPLYGGGTLLFDEYGRLKYYIHNSLDHPTRQSARISQLWRRGQLTGRAGFYSNIAAVHRLRTADHTLDKERWIDE
jgi:hypothetical protein